jgi:2-polyprenyl-3-methyl-5-hydroxy-6-metoxy-1,4-benzoquinol methylase
MEKSKVTCLVCNSENLARVNSYKHFCYVCGDCNNVFHIKKEFKYFLEWILPRSICKRILPQRAFLRLFHDKGDCAAADFYDVYAKECQEISEVRKSEVNQLLDTFSINGITLEGKKVLDVSGGPGYVGKYLKGVCAKIVVTEFSENATKAMAEVMGVETVKFDYTVDNLQNLFQEKFDVVLIRSSIIFCPKLDEFVCALSAVLNPDGYVLIETILPTLGEVLWWQQMEYKFPFIYSQETIEKNFYKHGFSLEYGQRDYGSYIGVKSRSTKGFMQKAYTWLLDYPMMLLYYIAAKKGKVAVDQSLQHKMLTQIWKKTDLFSSFPEKPYKNYMASDENQSIHFAYKYNGYLKKH